MNSAIVGLLIIIAIVVVAVAEYAMALNPHGSLAGNSAKPNTISGNLIANSTTTANTLTTPRTASRPLNTSPSTITSPNTTSSSSSSTNPTTQSASTTLSSYNITVTNATAYVGANSGKNNTTLIGVSVDNSANTPTTIYGMMISGGGKSLSFDVNPANSSMLLVQSVGTRYGFQLAAHQSTTFVYDNYQSRLLTPNQTYTVQMYGSSGAYGSQSFVAKLET